ncbi:Cell surface glycan-binding lipoprotein, utilization system for glycans and polysaccharides (PUL), SusD family [hydrothermal vent metagenome]|uniref:Cell surface glycan-binding lipoprotein, utilization system for glycans and polysaccharides (PUL), SusD family n=1 Tax=hydrothermal vent metagenome TaxID=652676 RepID=A0A3B0TTH8_9ZZZZ
MKKINSIFTTLICIMVFLFVGCDSQLDLTPNSQLASQDALNSLSDLETALTGSYSGMQSRTYYGRNLGGFAHMTSDNSLIPGGAGSFLNFEPFYQMTYTPANGATATWAQMYDIIARVNNVINNADGVDGVEADRNRIKGEALFIRALAHHDLLRLFAQDYKFTADAGHLGVPYITVSEIGSPSRNTVAECYGFILNDLSDAIGLMDNGSERASIDAPSFGSVSAAKAIRARIYLYMGEYANALTDADDVINNGGFTLAPYKVDDGAGGVDLSQIDSWSNRAPNSESIFELEFDEQDGLWTTSSLSRLFKPQPNGFGEAGPNLDIVDMYTATDVRKNWIIEVDGQNFINKYPDNDDVLLNFTVPVVRLTEMYLTKAESHANLNQTTEARDAINNITLRANVGEITSSGAQLLSNILDERRRELAFEGHRFFDIKRLQLDIVRNDCSLQNNCTVAYGDKLYAYPIPQEEIDANPNMEQNTGY